mgnify:FL=1
MQIKKGDFMRKIIITIFALVIASGVSIYSGIVNKNVAESKETKIKIDEPITNKEEINKNKEEIEVQEEDTPKEETEKNIENKSKSVSSNKAENNNINNSSKNTTEIINNSEVKETPIPKAEEQPKVVEEVKDDVIDTNSWFYSIHQGKIEMSSQDKCLAAGNEIAFIDTTDINYFRCYEVTSTTGKVLGYYLNIFCNSDNCNRYKSQIDMTKYK